MGVVGSILGCCRKLFREPGCLARPWFVDSSACSVPEASSHDSVSVAAGFAERSYITCPSRMLDLGEEAAKSAALGGEE